MKRLLVAIAPFAAACGQGSTAASIDAAVVDAASAASDATEVDAACGGSIDCWLVPYQRQVVARLAGAEDIGPGVRLAHRASAAERDHVRRYLMAELTALGYTPALHQYASAGANVVATLAPDGGVDQRLVIVGAHFDSVPAGPGAADNATGVAIVLAAARHLAQVPGRRHPVAFVLFDQEEIGLVGSRAYVERLLDDGVAVAEVHSFDMLSFDMDGDRALELWSPVPALDAAYRAAGAAAGVPIQPVTFTRSDHQAFLEKGLPAVGLGEEFVAMDHTPHYHAASDTFDKVDFAYLAAETRFVLGVIADGARVR